MSSGFTPVIACVFFSSAAALHIAITGTSQGIGLDAASIANNHAMDLGTPGMQSSMDALDAAGIAHTGPYGDVGYVEKDGLTIAFVGAHSGTCCLNVNDLDDVQRAIRKADQRADLVVLSFHGGAEGYGARHLPFKTEIAWGERRGNVKELAHAAIDQERRCAWSASLVTCNV